MKDEESHVAGEEVLLKRITFDPDFFGGKPIVRGRRLAVEHVLDMLASGDSPELILQGFSWLEKEDIQACILFATKVLRSESVERLPIKAVG